LALALVVTQVLGVGTPVLWQKTKAEAQVVQNAPIDPILEQLPEPGTMVTQTPEYVPLLLKGIKIHPDDAFKFNFIIDTGHSNYKAEEIKDQSSRLIKYFLAALTIPEESLWVNLSPHEKERIISHDLGHTEMGRDLLAQDYILKQLTASLIYPEDDLGDMFWEKIYAKAYEKFGTIEIPVNTFNKVWIVPQKAVVYENGNQAFVIDSKLKVMLEEDYLALKSNLSNKEIGTDQLIDDEVKEISGLSSEIVREVILPAIEKEVNEGKNFAQLRQIYHSMILAVWFKRNLKNSLINRLYVDQGKIQGIDVADKNIKEKIYERYVAALKKGVYDYIREDYDPKTDELIPRKYFSGGFEWPAGFPLSAVRNLPEGTEATGTLEDVEVNFSRIFHEQEHKRGGFAETFNSIQTEVQEAGLDIMVSPDGEIDFRTSLEMLASRRVVYGTGSEGQERFVELTDDDILVIVDDRFNLDHVGRDRRTVFAHRADKVAHEIKELRGWEAYWEKFWQTEVLAKGVSVPASILSSGVGTRIQYWANDEAASAPELARRQSELIKEFYRFHAHGLIEEGQQSQAQGLESDEKQAEGEWILDNLDKLPALPRPISGFDFFIASSATQIDPALFDENRSVAWDEYVSYRKLFRSDPAESEDVDTFMNSPEDFKRVVEDNQGESLPAKIETLITRQALRKQSIIELVANASDAIIRSLADDADEEGKTKSYPIGRFGMGGMQMQAFVLNKMKPLLEMAANITVETRSKETGEANKIFFFKGSDGRIRFNVTKSSRQGAGTTVRINFPAGMARGQRKSFERELKRRLNLFTRMRVYLNDEMLNTLDNHIFLDGQMVNYDFPQSRINVTMTDTDIIVEDQGDGMSEKLIRDKYLIPRLGENEEDLPPQSDEEIEEEVHLFYKGSRSLDREGKSRIVFQVAGINIQTVEVSGYALPADLVIQLPSSTKLTVARDNIEVDESTHTAVRLLAQKIVDKDPIHQTELINGFVQAVKILDEKNKRVEALPPLLFTVQEVFEPFILEKNILTLPNTRQFRQLKVPKDTLFLDEAIIYKISPDQIDGAKDISEGFRPGRLAQAFTVPFKQGARETFLEWGPYLLIDQKIYEKYKKYPLWLNLRLNYYRGYGRKSPSRGWILSEKQMAEKKKEQAQQEQVLPILEGFPELRSVITDGQIEFLRVYLDARHGKMHRPDYMFNPDVDASEENLKRLFARLEEFVAPLPGYIRKSVLWRLVFPFEGGFGNRPEAFERLLANPDLIMMPDEHFLVLNRAFFFGKKNEKRLGAYLRKLLFAEPLAYLDNQTTLHKLLSVIHFDGLAVIDHDVLRAAQDAFGRRSLDDYEEVFEAINKGIPHAADAAGIKRLILRWLRIYKDNPKMASIYAESLSQEYEREREVEFADEESLDVMNALLARHKDFLSHSFQSFEATGFKSNGKPLFVGIKDRWTRFYTVDPQDGGMEEFALIPQMTSASVAFTGEYENLEPIFMAMEVGPGPGEIRQGFYRLDLGSGNVRQMTSVGLPESLMRRIRDISPDEWSIKDTGITDTDGKRFLALSTLKIDGDQASKTIDLVYLDKAAKQLKHYGGHMTFGSDIENTRKHDWQYFQHENKVIVVDESRPTGKPRFFKVIHTGVAEINLTGAVGETTSEVSPGVTVIKKKEIAEYSGTRLVHKDEEGNYIFVSKRSPIMGLPAEMALYSVNPDTGEVKNINHDFTLNPTETVVDIQVLEQGPRPLVALTYEKETPVYVQKRHLIKILRLDAASGKAVEKGQFDARQFKENNPEGMAYDQETKTLAVRTSLLERKSILKTVEEIHGFHLFVFDLSMQPARPKGFVPLADREHKVLETSRLEEAKGVVFNPTQFEDSSQVADYYSLRFASTAGFKRDGKEVYVSGNIGSSEVEFFTWDADTRTKHVFAFFPFSREDPSKTAFLKVHNTGLKAKDGSLVFVAYETGDENAHEIQFFTFDPNTLGMKRCVRFMEHEKGVSYVKRVPYLDDKWQGYPAFESYSEADGKTFIFAVDIDKNQESRGSTQIGQTKPGERQGPVSLNTAHILLNGHPAYIKSEGNRIKLGYFSQDAFVMVWRSDIGMGQKVKNLDPLFVQNQEGHHAVLVTLQDNSQEILIYNPDKGDADTTYKAEIDDPDGTNFDLNLVKTTGLFSSDGKPLVYMVVGNEVVLLRLDLDRKEVRLVRVYSAADLMTKTLDALEAKGKITPADRAMLDTSQAQIEESFTEFLKDSGIMKIRISHPNWSEELDIFINYTEAGLIETKGQEQPLAKPKGFSPVKDHRVMKEGYSPGLFVDDSLDPTDLYLDAGRFGQSHKAGFTKDGGDVYISKGDLHNVEFFTWDGNNRRRRVFASYDFVKDDGSSSWGLRAKPTGLTDEKGLLIFVAYETINPGSEIQFFTFNPETGQTDLLGKCISSKGGVQDVRWSEIASDADGNPVFAIENVRGDLDFISLLNNKEAKHLFTSEIHYVPLGVAFDGHPVYAAQGSPKMIKFLTINDEWDGYSVLGEFKLDSEVMNLESLGVQDGEGNQALFIHYVDGSSAFLFYNPRTNKTNFIRSELFSDWSSVFLSDGDIYNTEMYTEEGHPIFVTIDRERIIYYSVDLEQRKFRVLEEKQIADVFTWIKAELKEAMPYLTGAEILLGETMFIPDPGFLKLGIKLPSGGIIYYYLNYDLPFNIESKKVAKTDLKKHKSAKKRFRTGWEMLAEDDDLSGLPAMERMILRFLKEEDVTLLEEGKTDSRKDSWQKIASLEDAQLDEPLTLAFMNFLFDKRAKTINDKEDMDFEKDFLPMVQALQGKNLEDYIKIIRKATQGQDKTQRSWVREVAVQNARDATRKAREQGLLGKEQGAIEIRNFIEGDDWVFSVRDHGTGMNLQHLLRKYFPLDQSSKDHLEDTGNLGQGNYTLFADFDRVFIRTSAGDGIIHEVEIVNDPAKGHVIARWDVLKGNYRGTEVRRIKSKDKGDPQLESLFVNEALINFAGGISSPKDKRKNGLQPDIRDVTIKYNGSTFSEGIDFDQSSFLSEDLGMIAIGRSKFKYRTRVVQDGILIKAPDEAELKYVPKWLRIAYERFGGMHISIGREVLLNIPRTGYLLEDEDMHQLQVAVLHNIIKAVLRDYVEKGAKIPAMPPGYFDDEWVIDRETAVAIANFMDEGEYDKITAEMLWPYLDNPARFFELLSHIPFISKAYEGPINLNEIRERLMEKSNLRPRRRSRIVGVKEAKFNAGFQAIGEFAANVTESFGSVEALGDGKIGGRLLASAVGRLAEEKSPEEAWKELPPNAKLVVDFYSRWFIQPVVREQMPRFDYKNKHDNVGAETHPRFNTIFWNLAWKQGMIRILVELAEDREALRSELEKGEESQLWQFLQTLVHESQHLAQFEEPGDHTHHDADQIEGYEDINDPRFGVRMGRAFDAILQGLSDDIMGEFLHSDEEMQAFVDKYKHAPSTPYARPADDEAWRFENRSSAQGDAGNPGGIDLDPGMMDFEVRGEGVPFNVPHDSPEFDNMRIDGLTPIIINVTPIPNLPLYLGEAQAESDSLVYAQ